MSPPLHHPSADGEAAGAPPTDSRIRLELRNIGIPPRPAILDEIDREMRQEEPDVKRLAGILASDVGLAASVIKVANSPYYGFGKKVRSVPDALLVLGLKVILQTVAGLALQKLFPHVPSLERFWDSAARTARVSGWLALELAGTARVRADDAYTLGLFRDCGIPVLMIPFAEYPQVLRRANSEPDLSFTAVEDQALAINHAQVGCELAREWLLPEDLFQGIRYHHDAAAIDGLADVGLSEPTRRLIAISQVAECLIHRATGLSQTLEWGKLGDACGRLLGIGEEDLATLQEGCGEVIAGQA